LAWQITFEGSEGRRKIQDQCNNWVSEIFACSGFLNNSSLPFIQADVHSDIQDWQRDTCSSKHNFYSYSTDLSSFENVVLRKWCRLTEGWQICLDRHTQSFSGTDRWLNYLSHSESMIISFVSFYFSQTPYTIFWFFFQFGVLPCQAGQTLVNAAWFGNPWLSSKGPYNKFDHDFKVKVLVGLNYAGQGEMQTTTNKHRPVLCWAPVWIFNGFKPSALFPRSTLYMRQFWWPTPRNCLGSVLYERFSLLYVMETHFLKHHRVSIVIRGSAGPMEQGGVS
jgi:hypothetical protein